MGLMQSDLTEHMIHLSSKYKGQRRPTSLLVWCWELPLKASFYLSLQGRKISSLRTHKTGRGDEVALKNNLPDGLEKLERWKNPFSFFSCSCVPIFFLWCSLCSFSIFYKHRLYSLLTGQNFWPVSFPSLSIILSNKMFATIPLESAKCSSAGTTMDNTRNTNLRNFKNCNNCYNYWN